MDDWIEELEELEDYEYLTNSENRRSIPINKYFDDMKLSKKQKEKRKKFAKKFFNIMLFAFSLIDLMKERERINTDYVEQQIKDRYLDLLDDVTVDEYVEEYIDLFASETVDTTIRNIDDEFYLSDDRALLIAENEANGIYNYQEFIDAIEQGKTRKKWVDMKDDKERETHLEVGGRTIPIERAFVVGQSLMLFPKDRSMGASMSEIANCRCTIQYL